MELEQEEGDFEPEVAEVTTEQRARAMGWKPREEYRGNPERWTDAEEFIRHGEEELPILRDQNRRMAEKLVRIEGRMGELTNTIEEQRQAVQDAVNLARRADNAGYQRAISELKAKQRAAAESADIETFDKIGEQIAAAERERTASEGNVTIPAPRAAAPTPPAQPQVAPETSAFVAANPWFNSHAILRNAMIAAHQDVMNRHPTVPLAEQYEMAKQDVIASFPHLFPSERAANEDEPVIDTAPARPRPKLRAAPLNPSAQGLPPRRNTSAFDRIEDPAERKDAVDAYQRFKNNGSDLTEDEYVNLFLNPKTDVLAMRRARKAS